MIVEKYTEETACGKKRHSREICSKCNWVDYDSPWTSHKNPNKIS